jgi:cytochrome c peroxidase
LKKSPLTADLLDRKMFWSFSSLLLAAVLHQPADSGKLITLRTSANSLELKEFHSWTIELPAGQHLTEIHFDATMPAHGHGLATQPRIQPSGPGSFTVEGVRFHMPGKWQLRVRFHDAAGAHSYVFPFEVNYSSTLLRSLWLGARQPVRPDPTNRFADNKEAAALGKQLFFDKRLSGDGTTSCGTCHKPEAAFADNLRVSKPAVTRNSQGLLGVSESPWLFWDGRRDSLWSQALLPIESPVEMAGNRKGVAQLLEADVEYRQVYSRLTGSEPSQVPIDRRFADTGKFLAAYERTLQPKPSRFDRYVEQLESAKPATALTNDEVAGLQIFLSPQARCTQCHNGPLFTNQGFHNIGTATQDGPQPDFGRAMGMVSLAYDFFNCRSVYSDSRDQCPSLAFAKADGHDGLLTGAFKVPGLRDVALTAPYMHDGSLATLEDVIEHYRHPPKAASELRPLEITDEQAKQLVSFLKSLTGQN